MNAKRGSTVNGMCKKKALKANVLSHAPSVFQQLLKAEETIDIFASFSLRDNQEAIKLAG